MTEVPDYYRPDLFGTVYLIHFDVPYKHCRHYIGFTTLPLEKRIKRHFQQNGARLLQVVTKAHIPWYVVRTWKNVPQTKEWELKRAHNAARFCPICSSKISNQKQEEQ